MKTLPKYIVSLLEEKRLRPCLYKDNDDNRDFWGYTFRLNQRFRTTEDGRFKRDLQRLVDYAQRNHADAMILECDYHMNRGSRIWSAIIGISDPVAQAIESACHMKRSITGEA